MKTKPTHAVNFLLILLMAASFFSSNSFADTDQIPLYRQPARSLKMPQDNQDETIATSPKPGWKQLPQRGSVRESKSNPWWAEVLLWIPNRVMDFIDVFRVDVGIGPAIGGVARFSKHGQAGLRRMYPFSFRVGDFGRKMPFLIETGYEQGAGNTFRQSSDRTVCNSEIGLGLDLGLGGYAGICTEEVLDFFAGLIFIDLEADDM